MFGKILSAFVAGLAAVSAYTTPVGDPTGNPIATPGLSQIVPVGQPFQITWNPTTQGTVTLVLLRGPSTNVVPIGTIAEGIDNTGSYTWTPSTDLQDDVTHYGIQLIVDATGQYQYSTQFGISNPGNSGSSSSSSTWPTSSVASSTSWPSGKTTTAVVSTSTTVPCTTLSTSTQKWTGPWYPSGSGYPTNKNGTTSSTVQWTPQSGPQTTSASGSTSTTSSKPAVQTTNAGAKVVASFGGAAVALFAAVAAL